MQIYKIINLINNKVYIGKTIKSVERRFKEHIRDASKNIRKSILYNAIRKYGSKNFKIEIIDNCYSNDHLSFMECFHIQKENSLVPNGYNLTMGGEGVMAGRKHSAETIEKIRIGNIGSHPKKLAPRSNESKIKMSMITKNRYKNKSAREKTRKASILFWKKRKEMNSLKFNLENN